MQKSMEETRTRKTSEVYTEQAGKRTDLQTDRKTDRNMLQSRFFSLDVDKKNILKISK